LYSQKNKGKAGNTLKTYETCKNHLLKFAKKVLPKLEVEKYSMAEHDKLLEYLMYGLEHFQYSVWRGEAAEGVFQVLPGGRETIPASGGQRTQGRVPGGGKDLPHLGGAREAGRG
jgi:hypothetical protein